jgi:uncharacterized tellurite resistance protein B-like protein
MLDSIKQFFESKLQIQDPDDPLERERNLQLATAALLVELIKSDHEVVESEWTSVRDLLKKTFQLSPDDLEEIIILAEESSRHSTDLFQYTQLINEHYEYMDKCELLKLMWQVARADGRIDKFEEHLIRKIAGLIYVSHPDFIKAKHASR